MSREHDGVKRATGGALARLRRRCLDRDDWRCVKCGSPRDLEMHHKVSLAAGGDPLALDNVLMLCAGCHIDTHPGDYTPRDPERAAWRRLLWEGV